jgi:predicted phosphodiesterase
MLVLGDAHADTPARREALLAAYDAAEADVALCLGDIEYYDLPVPTYFIAGNNEDFDVIDALRAGETPDGVRNAHLLASTAETVGGLRVAGLSGNFAPTRFEKARDDLVGDRRRHFVRAEIERANALDDVDVFLTHEAPEGLISYGYDAGCEHVTDLLSALDPDLCLVGHHHTHVEATIAGVRTISLAPVWERYYTLDPATLALESHAAPVEAPAPE